MEPDSVVEAVPCASFASLPRFLALEIFARLPADARLLLALVSSSWRALVAEPSLWACVDLTSDASGVTRASDALLLACSAKARGGMRSLDVCGQVWAVSVYFRERPSVSHAALLTTLQNNAHSLRHLWALCPALQTDWTVWQFLNKIRPRTLATATELDYLLCAAPDLTHIEVDIDVDTFDASLLRNGVVSVRRLSVHHFTTSFSAFLVDARRCLSLVEMQLGGPLDAPDIEALLVCPQQTPHGAWPN